VHKGQKEENLNVLPLRLLCSLWQKNRICYFSALFVQFVKFVDEFRPGFGIFWEIRPKNGMARKKRSVFGRKWQNGTVWDSPFAGAKSPAPCRKRSYEKSGAKNTHNVKQNKADKGTASTRTHINHYIKRKYRFFAGELKIHNSSRIAYLSAPPDGSKKEMYTAGSPAAV
jgi:hypothetical protein